MIPKELVRFGLIVFALGALNGCYVETDGPLLVSDAYLADLEVNWSVEGSDSVRACDLYGIDRWELTVSGPEDRSTIVLCDRDYWSSENDLLALEEGSYTVHLDAIDYDNLVLTSTSEHISLVDRGGVETLTFDFVDSDFP